MVGLDGAGSPVVAAAGAESVGAVLLSVDVFAGEVFAGWEELLAACL